MKLARIGAIGRECPVIVADDGSYRNLSGWISDLGGPALMPSSLSRLRRLDPYALPSLDPKLRIGPCIANVPNFICVGLNYAEHARESGVAAPREPVLFMKATSAISGPNDDVIIPKGSEKTDWEVELGVVIGTRCSNVSEQDALEHVAGYLVVNDVSERAFQLEGTGQWVKGKSSDTFGPLGPWLVTRDEISDPQGLDLWLEVNGQSRQRGSTRDMLFSVATLISYISRYMTLSVGDIVSTGTPPGVGLGRNPPCYLRPGDIMSLGITGLGSQTQKLVPWVGVVK